MLLCLLVALGPLACRRAPVPVDLPLPASPAAAPVAPAGLASAGLAPLGAESWLVTLPVAAHPPSLVSVPLGATTPRPVMVALHGVADRPEWACGGFRGVTDGYPFILCPAGQPNPGGASFTLEPPEGLMEEIDEGLAALQARFGPHLRPGPPVYAGFSLGAIRGVSILARQASRFPRAMLVEGGFSSLTAAWAAGYASGGGQRLLLVCAAPGCDRGLGPTVRRLREHGVDADALGGPHLVHNLDGEMVSALRGRWLWLVRDDPAWADAPR